MPPCATSSKRSWDLRRVDRGGLILQAKTLLDVVLTNDAVLFHLPRYADDSLRTLLRGELRTQVSLLSEPEDVCLLRGFDNRMVIGGIDCTLALTSAVQLTVPTPQDQDVSVLGVAGGTGLTFAALLILRTVVQVMREDG